MTADDVRFKDRREAGRLLAGRLGQYRGRDDVIVLALPRGGVPVGYEIARAVDAPLDVLIVRKLGVPFQPELAMGAVASGGVRFINRPLVEELRLDQTTIEQATAQALREVQRREHAYRDGRPAPDLRGRTVILVDDGLATGATMRAALQAVRQHGAARVVVAAPVAAPETARAFEQLADEFCCLTEPANFIAIGYWYVDFEQVPDDQVRELLGRAEHERGKCHSVGTGRRAEGDEPG